jgi:hypothetical protein
MEYLYFTVPGFVILLVVLLVMIFDKCRINHTIEKLNDEKGGDWYYDKKDRSYHDSMTDRVFNSVTPNGHA